jgi:serine/threonine protein kinase
MTKYTSTLEKVLALCAARKRPLPWEVALHYAGTLAAVLDDLHVRDRLVHRNLKPSNILIRTANGMVPGGDFGTGLAGSDALAGDLGLACQVGQVDGLVIAQDGWKAPEVDCGASVPANPAEDVYSLGKVLQSVAEAVGHGECDPAGLLDLARSCIRPNPGDRPTARSLLEEIRRLAGEGSTVLLPSRYVVRRELGRGSFGVVYLAHDSVLDRQVAIKVLRPECDDKLKEARLLANLRHAGVVRVYDVGRLPGGAQFIVMDYIEGGTLEGLLVEDPRAPGRVVPVAPLRAAALLRLVAEALAYLHRRGWVHGDLKPTNILLDGESPLLADFGLALRRGPQRTGGGGTPLYMAPEQAAAFLAPGGPPGPDRVVDRHVDGRTDVWAVGLILYRMLSGEHAFYQPGDREDAVLNKIIHTPPADPREINLAIPDRLAAICRDCLLKERADRPIAADLARRLGAVEDALLLEIDVEPTEEMREQVLPCRRYTRPVPAEWVFPRWIAVFTHLTCEYERARAVLDKAIRLRRSVDPGATVPIPEYGSTARLDSYWANVLRQACLHGPRMLAALVIVVPAGSVTEEEREAFLEARATLLDQLYTL